MANKEHLELLEKGVAVWNEWRQRDSGTNPDLRGASLRDLDLRQVNLNGADLSGADIGGTDLSGAGMVYANLCGVVRKPDAGGFTRTANFKGADLSRAALAEANLTGANLSQATLIGAELTGAMLSRTDLGRAELVGAILRCDLRCSNLSFANLNGADLSRADLRDARLNGANLTGANLSHANLGGSYWDDAMIGATILADLDMIDARGLDAVKHLGPSSIGLDTRYKSSGRIPDEFLRKAGVPEDFLARLRPLIRQITRPSEGSKICQRP